MDAKALARAFTSAVGGQRLDGRSTDGNVEISVIRSSSLKFEYGSFLKCEKVKAC